MNSKRSFVLGAIGAGFLIGLASAAFCRLEKPLGAALFGLGLLVVLIEQLWLFTGRIGYLNRENYKSVLACLPFNILGAAFCAILAVWAFGSDLGAVAVAEKKLALPPLQVFVRAMFCGFCMVTAVESWKKANSTWGVLLSVFIFVASGFEHCIADVFYLVAGSSQWASVARFIGIAILGNACGSLLLKAFLPDAPKPTAK
ncbi:MAG: formate/nitrite transporter family protein [Thermoguttaceae bacterium]|nr:formate/nitrite transporter family protein [Thermoguttaceae bacterium]